MAPPAPGDAPEQLGDAGQAPAAPQAPAPTDSAAGEIPGVIPPRRRGHSGRFITDVMIELGYVTKEQVDLAISESPGAGRSPEEILLEKSLINSDQLSRAVAERYGLDYIDLNTYPVSYTHLTLPTTPYV